MKCPFCNADMKEEQVFCESCGKEIHLVPLFDPSVELTMEQSLSGIADHVAEDAESIEESEDIEAEASTQEEASKKLPYKKIIGLVVGFVVTLVIVVCLIIMIPKMFRPEVYYDGALSAYDIGNEERAKQYALKALEKQLPIDKQYDMAMLIASISAKNAIYDDAATYYKKCISLKPEEAIPYESLIALYERTEAYAQIAKLLASCNNPQIITTYAKYLANKPSFDTPSGKYDEVIYQKLMTDGEGEIHYTINGDKPSKDSELYVLPIKLETGNFHIEAIFINQYGVASEATSVDLEINVSTPDGPEISLDSGSYHEPQTIDVFMPDQSYSVYYTIDGETPDLSSIKYESSLLLEMGSHTYRFIMYDEDGVASDVEEREYQLDIAGAVFDIEQAKYMLIQNLIVRGILIDAAGHSAGNGELKQYQSGSAFSSEGQSFYLFIETVGDSSGGNIATGSLYGVQVQTGEVYKVTTDDSGLFFVEGL